MNYSSHTLRRRIFMNVSLTKDFYVSWELLLGYKAKKIVGKFWL